MCYLFLRELLKSGASLDVYSTEDLGDCEDLRVGFDGLQNSVFSIPDRLELELLVWPQSQVCFYSKLH